jgi:hypothetical protein
MTEKWIKTFGIVTRGHQVASQRSEHYPHGTIAMQAPFFKERGLDLSSYYAGTLNIVIAPKVFRLMQPEFTFRNVNWTIHHPPEDFSFARCRINYRNDHYDGWIYYPHPETKQRHFQNPSLVEVIAPLIPGIAYGDQVELIVNANEVAIINP